MSRPKDRPAARGDSGFALILAILALMLLTFLGLTLSTTTSTELQIAANQHWSQAARYNAEAGIEAGKNLLRTMNWTVLLPTARAAWTPTVLAVGLGMAPAANFARPDAWLNPTRNFENGAVAAGNTCDTRGNGAGYGVVLDDGGASAPYQNVVTLFNQNLKGSVTIWVRRALIWNDNGTAMDDPSNTTLVLTAEGSAPAYQANAAFRGNRAVSIMEITLTQTLSNVCGTRVGQTGGGPEGSGFSACDKVTGGGLAAVLGAATTDRGVQ